MRNQFNALKNEQDPLAQLKPFVDNLLRGDLFYQHGTFFGPKTAYGFLVDERKMVYQLACMFLEFGYPQILQGLYTMQQSRTFFSDKDAADLAGALRSIGDVPEYIVGAMLGSIATVSNFMFEGRKYLKDKPPFLDATVLGSCALTPAIDLDLVDVGGDGEVRYQGRPMARGRKLGQGSMGAVYVYKDDITGASCAVKYVDPKDPEIDILTRLLEGNEGCRVVRSRLLGVTAEKGIIAMETMGGDLTVFQGKLDVDKVAYVVNLCADAFLCLIASVDLYYFDIKCMNALYKCTKNEQGQYAFEVKVADLGSLFPLHAPGVTTYLCPYVDRKDGVVFVLPQSEVSPIVVYPHSLVGGQEDVRTLGFPRADGGIARLKVYGPLKPATTYLLKHWKGTTWLAVELKDGEDPRLGMVPLYEKLANAL